MSHRFSATRFIQTWNEVQKWSQLSTWFYHERASQYLTVTSSYGNTPLSSFNSDRYTCPQSCQAEFCVLHSTCLCWLTVVEFQTRAFYFWQKNFSVDFRCLLVLKKENFGVLFLNEMLKTSRWINGWKKKEKERNISFIYQNLIRYFNVALNIEINWGCS